MTPTPRPDPHARPDAVDRLAMTRADMARWLDGPGSTPAASALALPERAARAVLATAAQRNPWGLVTGAAAAGAALAVLRPWRWCLRPSLLAAVAAPLVSDLASQWLRQALSAAPPRSRDALASDTEPDPPLD